LRTVNRPREETDIERIKNSLTDQRASKSACRGPLKDKRQVTGYLGEMRDDDFILIRRHRQR